MKTKLFFTLIVFGFSTFSGSVFAQSWLSELNFTNIGGNTRRINFLNFDGNQSNISLVQSEKAMSGFFSGITPSGSYSISLDRKSVGDAPGSDALLWTTTFGTGCLWPLLGLPVVLYIHRLILCIQIRDLNGNLIKTVTRAEDYTISYNMYNMFDISKSEIAKMSEIYSRLISQARNELNYEAANINNRLSSVSQSFERNFDELSANLRNGTGIAIFPISGDPVESNRVLNELTRYFVNSGKKYFVVNRDSIDKVIKEIVFQGSLYVDQATAVRIGRFVGARVIIIGHVDIINNGKQLFVQAVDIETTQTVGISSVTY
jgi:hypothetical protein